jgi:dienelactone hydrolase
MGWPGWNWEAWKEISGEERPEITSPQAGSSELFPLFETGEGEPSRIRSIRDWETKRDQILERLSALLGHPDDLAPVPPHAEVLDEEDRGTYVRRHIRIASEPDDWIPAYLLSPKPLPTKPTPTMIVIHQTVPQGKEEPCGIKGSSELAFGVELVERGYVVLAPDMIGFGERIPTGADCYAQSLDFYRKHPKWSFFGKMAWDISRIVDWLETQPEVDPRRIGSMGHSHGAYSTLMGAIFEPRLSAAVTSCGFNTLRTDPTPNRWSHLTALLPRLGFYVEDIKAAPFDWHEVIACLSPRPYFNWATLDDACFPNTENLSGIFDDLREVYGLYGAADVLESHLVPGEHRFPIPGRKRAYEWLDKQLAPRPEKLPLLAKVTPASPDGTAESRETRRSEWEKGREGIKMLLLRDIGAVDPPKWEPAYEVVGSTQHEGYLEKKIHYHLPTDETVSGYLLLPEPLEEKHPGVVVFHQTVAEGKEEPAGHCGKTDFHFGPELARRGYVVLIPDSICAGERTPEAGAFRTEDFYRRFPTLSALGKMIQDGRAALDLLVSLPEVDSERIGAMGHSLGAEEALFVAAFDERVKAAAGSCGFAPFHAEKNPSRWARDYWFSYIPRLRPDFRAGRLPAWDFDDVVGLVAPRGYFNYQTSEDEIFPEAASAQPLVESVRPIWGLYGAEDRLVNRLETGPHGISDGGKAEIYAFLDGLLKGTPG